jgi:hypothetical protein
MSLEKAYNIYNQFKSVELQMVNIRKMYEDTKALELNKLTAENPGFVEAAYGLLDFVKDFVKEIEESDTNLNPDTTKLEGVDKFFEGHHATKFVNNALNEVYNSQGVPTTAFTNKPCCDECTDPCPCDGIDEVKDAILRVTDPVKEFTRPNKDCTKDCSSQHCLCEDGW